MHSKSDTAFTGQSAVSSATLTPRTGLEYSSSVEEYRNVSHHRHSSGSWESENTLTFDLLYVQYYSRRISSMSYLEVTDSVFLGFETGDVLAYNLQLSTSVPRSTTQAPQSETLTPSGVSSVSSFDDDESLIDAFHDDYDGSHLNKLTDDEGISRYDPTTSFDKRQAQKKSVRRIDLPLLSHVGSCIALLEVIFWNNVPYLFIGAQGDFCILYNLENKEPWGKPVSLPSPPRCLAVHPFLPVLALGLTDGSVGLYKFVDNDTQPLECTAVSASRPISAQRTEFIQFLDIKAYPDRVRELYGENESIPWGPEDTLLLCGGKDNGIFCWIVSQAGSDFFMKPLSRIARATVDVPTAGLLDPTCLHVVVGTKSGVVTALCPLTGQPVFGFESHIESIAGHNNFGGHGDGITSMQWVPYKNSQRLLLTSGRDGCVHFWRWPLSPYESYMRLKVGLE